MIVARLATLDPAALRERARVTGDPALALAEALGASDPAAAAEAVAAIAPHYNPAPSAAPPGADAQLIAILVQSHAATAALIAAGGALEPPPVPLTRRIAPDGSLVEVDLAGRPFGAGPRACPGAEHALALAEGVLSRR